MKIELGYWRTLSNNKVRVICVDADKEHLGKLPIVVLGVGGNLYRVSKDGIAYNDGDLANLVSPWVDAPVVDWGAERDWVKAIVRNGSGDWFRLDQVPKASEFGWAGYCLDQRMHPSERPAFTGRWEDSLCVRPEGGK